MMGSVAPKGQLIEKGGFLLITRTWLFAIAATSSVTVLFKASPWTDATQKPKNFISESLYSIREQNSWCLFGICYCSRGNCVEAMEKSSLIPTLRAWTFNKDVPEILRLLITELGWVTNGDLQEHSFIIILSHFQNESIAHQMGIVRFWNNLFREISIIKVLRKYQQRKMRQAILDDGNMNSERSLLLERSITPRSIIRNEYAASELSGDGKSGVDICHIMEEEESIAGDDQVCYIKTEDHFRLFILTGLVRLWRMQLRRRRRRISRLGKQEGKCRWCRLRCKLKRTCSERNL